MVKIRNANKNGTLAVSIGDSMKADGFTKGAEADWVKENGAWQLKLRVKPVAAAPEPSSPAAAGTE